MKRYFLLFVLLFVNDFANAENSKYFAGAGALSCQAYNAGENYHDAVFYWIQGYMSGMNVILRMAKAKQVDLWSMSVEEQQAFIRNYCINNSSNFVAQAGDSLFDRLMKIQQ